MPTVAVHPHGVAITALDLDTQIEQAEQRLIAREESLRRRLGQLKQGLRDATRPRRLFAPLAGAGVALAVLAGILRRLLGGSSARTAVRSSAALRNPRGSFGELPWVGLLGLAWPLLPTRWRDRVSPGMAATVLSVGLPLVEQVLARKRRPPLATVEHVDLMRYAGDWHQIAHLPASFEAVCEGRPVATYTPLGGIVEVANCCHKHGGGRVCARGVAHVVPNSGNAKLRVNFLPGWLRWLPFGWADYWILHLASDYSVALVGHPNRRSLWVLARRPQLAAAELAALVEIARDDGFPVERLKLVQPG